MSAEWLRTVLITTDDGGALGGFGGEGGMSMFETPSESRVAPRAKGTGNSELSSGLCSLLIKCVCARKGARVWVRVSVIMASFSFQLRL